MNLLEKLKAQFARDLVKRRLKAAFRRVPKPAQPAKPDMPVYKCVPVKPTEEMQDAAILSLGWCPEDNDLRIDLRVGYRAMVAAATAPQPAKPVTALTEAAQAVVDRWDTPLWKDAPATAKFIHALRDALKETP